MASNKWRLNVNASNHASFAAVSNITMSATPGGANLCVGGTPLGGSTASGVPANAFDGTTTEWTGSMPTPWIEYDFTGPVTITGYTVECSTFPFKGWTLEYWDGSAWQITDTVTNQINWAANEVRSFPLLSKMQWRVSITAAESTPYGGFGEIQLRTAAGGANQATVLMQGSALGSTSSTPQNALDSNPATYWVNNTPTWWMYWFKAPTDIVEYVMQAGTGVPQWAPKSWTLEYWNGTAWTVADTRASQANWTASESRTFTVPSGAAAMSAYSNLVILDGAANYWRLNEPSGTTAVDVIGGKNGTISGGVTLNQPGALSDGDPAMAFNGTTGKVATAAGVIALGTGSVTVEAWCKSSAALTQRFVVDGALEANLNFPGVLIRAMTVPSLNVLALKGDGTTAVEVAWGTPWTDGAWRHIVGVVSRGAPDQLLLYGNGALIASLPFPTAGWNLTSAQPWCIGNSVASGLPWGGLLDDVAIYPVALTPAQIAAHYTVGKIGKTAPTTYADRVILDGASNYWRLNEPSGTTAVDVIGGANGTISGGVTLAQPGALSDGDKAMTFNGTTGKIQTVASVLIPLIVSIELWFKTSATGDRMLFSTRGLSTGSTVVCYVDATGVLGFFSDQGGSGSRVVRDGQWHHAVYVLDGVNCAVYTDGTLDRQSGSTRATPSTGPAAIGWDQPNPQVWNGQLDDVAIYPVALTPAQIAAHYQARLLSGARRPLPAFVLAHRRFPS